jgi:hypothetical protein
VLANEICNWQRVWPTVNCRLVLFLVLYAYHQTKEAARFTCDPGIQTASDRYPKVKRESYPCNQPWRPIATGNTQEPIFSIQSSQSWRWGKPCVAATLFLQEDSYYSFISESTTGHSATGRTKWIAKKSSDNIGNQARDLPAYSIVPQPATLLRGTTIKVKKVKKFVSLK